MALSTTHVATAPFWVVGWASPGAEVRWAVAGRMAVAWLVTLPTVPLAGALTFWLGHGIGSVTTDLVGSIVIFAVLVALSAYMWWRAQQQKVDHTNVNADWDASTNSVVPADVRAAATERKEDHRVGREGQLMHYLESIFRVLVVGLVLGAGLPALFAIGLRLYSTGAGGVDEDGVVHAPRRSSNRSVHCCSCS